MHNLKPADGAGRHGAAARFVVGHASCQASGYKNFHNKYPYSECYSQWLAIYARELARYIIAMDNICAPCEEVSVDAESYTRPQEHCGLCG